MRLYPAIDLKDGQAVRLYKGAMDQATVFNADPAAQARAFIAAGAERLHLVDLNGAFAGSPVNAAVVREIRDAVDVPIQLGGGIRTLDQIAAWLDAGIDRVILGTVAVKSPDVVRVACARWPDSIIVGLDARGGYVATEGWAEASKLKTEELAAKFADAGVAAIIFTDIDRDGTLEGVNVPATCALADAVPIPIIASGGVRGAADLAELAQAAQATTGRIDGVVVGRALYDGGLTIEQAVSALGQTA